MGGHQPFQREKLPVSAFAQHRLQHQADPHHRQRVEHEQPESGDLVEPASGAYRGEYAERDGDQVGQRDGPEVQRDGHREPFEDDGRDGTPGIDRGRGAEVSLQRHIAQPQGEAGQDGLVQIQLFAHGAVGGGSPFGTVHSGSGRIAAEHTAPGRISRRKPQQHIADQQDHQQREGRQQQPPDQVLNHQLLLSEGTATRLSSHAPARNGTASSVIPYSERPKSQTATPIRIGPSTVVNLPKML